MYTLFYKMKKLDIAKCKMARQFKFISHKWSSIICFRFNVLQTTNILPYIMI